MEGWVGGTEAAKRGRPERARYREDGGIFTGNAETFGGHWVVHLGASTIHMDTMIMTWVVMAILVGLAVVATSRLRRIPRGLQNVIEMAIEFLEGLMKENAAPAARECFPVVGTLFLFILFSNLLGLVPGLKSPTADLNVTAALAVVVLGLTVFVGARVKGLWGYIVSFFKPNPLFLPLNILEVATRTITLAFRLFGNMFAGDVLVIILGKLVAYAVPVVGQAFHVFIGVLQAYLFTMLTIAYISVIVEE